MNQTHFVIIFRVSVVSCWNFLLGSKSERLTWLQILNSLSWTKLIAPNKSFILFVRTAKSESRDKNRLNWNHLVQRNRINHKPMVWCSWRWRVVDYQQNMNRMRCKETAKTIRIWQFLVCQFNSESNEWATVSDKRMKKCFNWSY